MVLIAPFDAHNHVHLGPTLPFPLLGVDAAGTNNYLSSWKQENVEAPGHANLLGENALGGMAIMSTHPRDFSLVTGLAEKSSANKPVIPCIGVHPWFLHELDEDTEWSQYDTGTVKPVRPPPSWILKIQELLEKHPSIPVGEIGLDGFHFDPTTKELTSPMERQILALEWQLDLAIQYQRPVSMHCVRAMGPMMDTLAKVCKKNKNQLPPKIYFHAFGGKLGTATQLYKTLERKRGTTCRVYFGFAPVINFDSPKTLQVIQEVGIDRLVLETDHEDAALVLSSMEHGVRVISQALDMSEDELIERTNRNAADLYSLSE